MGRFETGRTGARFGAPARRAEPDPEPGPAEPVPGAGSDLAPPAGARFGGRARALRRRAEKAAAAQAAADREQRQAPEQDLPGPPPEPDRACETAPMPRVVDRPEPAPAGVAPVRPYVVTGGRTRVRIELRVETLVTAVAGPGGDVGERRSVLELCSRPRSVSEVAALTGVPLGVARVLIDDLATEGRLRVHDGVDATGPDMALLDRVLSGLRRL